MTLNSWTFVFEVVNFLVLAYILQRVLYRPLHDAVDRRRKEIADAQSDAVRMQHEAEEQRHKLDAQLAGIADERLAMLQSARQDAQTEREHILSEAAREVTHRAEQGQASLEQERIQVMQSLRSDIVQSAATLAERLLREASGEDLDTRLAMHLAETLRSLSPKERDRLTQGWNAGEAATLQAAHAVAPDGVKQVHDALSALLGRDVVLQIQSAPELVSGVRLQIDGHVWDASLANQLKGSDDGSVPVAAG